MPPKKRVRRGRPAAPRVHDVHDFRPNLSDISDDDLGSEDSEVSFNSSNVGHSATRQLSFAEHNPSMSIVEHDDSDSDSYDALPFRKFELGRRVKRSTIKKIHNKRFVNLSSLLPDRTDQSDKLNINEWLTAWATFSTIYSTFFPEASPGLWQYAEDIRAAALRTNSWEQYDIEFRRKMVYLPMEFGVRDIDLWGMYIIGTMGLSHVASARSVVPLSSLSSVPVSSVTRPLLAQPSTSVSRAPRRPTSAPVSNPFQSGFCRFYNLYRRGCTFNNCTLKHLCPKCFVKHPQTLCPVDPAVPKD